MTDPCNKGPDIDRLNTKVDSLIAAQQATSTDLKQAIDKLTSVIMTDIETRAEVEQLKKDREITYRLVHSIVARLDAIEIRNAKCDGAGIFENFPKVWDYIQQEKGWRRFLPALLTGLSFLILLFNSFGDNFVTKHRHDTLLTKDPRGSVKQDVGVDTRQTH